MPTDSATPLVTVQTPDPAWGAAIRARRAVLWIAPGAFVNAEGRLRPSEVNEVLRSLLLHPWAAVFVDVADLPLEQFRDDHPQVGDLQLRVLSEVQPSLPPNRMPVYALAGAAAPGALRPRSAASTMLRRFELLKRTPADADVFIVGASGALGAAALRDALEEARELSDTFSRCVVIATDFPADFAVPGITRVTRWATPTESFYAFLDAADALEGEAERLLVRVESREGPKSIPLHGCIDRSAPVTDAFEVIPFSSVVDERPASMAEVQAFLTSPTAVWRPYAAGVPYVRHHAQRRELLSVLARFRRDGPAATSTVWLPAEDGSGATTTLRHLAFDLARAGYPVLVARPDAVRFDFHLLTQFLTRAGERFASEDVPSSETAWVLAFDAQHTQLHWDFVTGLAAGLKKLQRPAVVLAVRADDGLSSDARRNALGTNRVLRPKLRSSLSADEASALGDHLNAYLPAPFHRSRTEWTRFLEETLRSTAEGPRSLFWVALRFWLLRVPGTDVPLRAWLSARLRTLTAGRPVLFAAVLETAALARHRLTMPRGLLTPGALADLRAVAEDSSNAVGLVHVRTASAMGFSIAHPLLADEVLRLAAVDDGALEAVEKPMCVGTFDLELHLLERVLSREAIGSAEGVVLVEELVTSALRVDPREAPRNYQERERIVAMLERIPDAVWDDSQIVNHHVAKARRHLAVDPPSPSWGTAAIREQLDLAENHLRDAIEFITPEDVDRRESPLNLRVSLALTLDARAKFEHRQGDVAVAAMYRDRAEHAYHQAQRTDADNSYVLENYARFKLNRATRFETGDARVRLIVDAITLLQWEWLMDQSGLREEPILLDLASAYEVLERDVGTGLLRRLADDGSEAAIVALAQLAMRRREDEDEVIADGARVEDASALGGWSSDAAALAEAERLLRRVPVSEVSPRSAFVLYQVVSRLRPYDFPGRLEILAALDADADFAWPLQTRLEFGILLFQVGLPTDRRKGQDVFRDLREQLSERSASLTVPKELRFLADPKQAFTHRLRTSITIRRVMDGGRSYFGVPYGWGAVEVPCRAHDFGPNLRSGTERDCLIRFTNFGPQAVPTTAE